MNQFDAVVVGGGFFGCLVACHLRRYLARVLVVEKEADLLLKASYHNQARVHRGYHYPRSLLTAVRSRVNYARFLADYADCVDCQFENYYAVARTFSKVSAAQFELFCRRIGAPLEPAHAAVRRLFDPNTIEDVYQVEEAAFDAAKLRGCVRARLGEKGVTVRLAAEVVRARPCADASVLLDCRDGGGPFEVHAGRVYNCTYARLNDLLMRSGVAPLPLKYELTELAIVAVPAHLQHFGVTVMCGPFFSLVPFPALGRHALSHVRYTPHGSWTQSNPPAALTTADMEGRSRFELMRRDSARYLPAVADVRYLHSHWEVKTVLPVNEEDDGRPILFRRDAGMPNLHCVLGAKLDNIYDVLDEIDRDYRLIKEAA